MIKLIADKISINGPSIDGSWKVTFELGEYMAPQVKKLMDLIGKVIELKIDEKRDS